jgi:hypothetical protein
VYDGLFISFAVDLLWAPMNSSVVAGHFVHPCISLGCLPRPEGLQSVQASGQEDVSSESLIVYLSHSGPQSFWN